MMFGRRGDVTVGYCMQVAPPFPWSCSGEKALRRKAGAGEGLLVDNGVEGAVGWCRSPNQPQDYDDPQQHHLPRGQYPEGTERSSNCMTDNMKDRYSYCS